MATPTELVDAQAIARNALLKLITELVKRILGGFSGWYSPRDVTEMAERVADIVEAGQRQAAAQTDAYLARIGSEMNDRDLPAVGQVDVSNLREGTPHTAVYERVAAQFRYDVSRGIPPVEAAERATTRALVMAEMDLSLAHRAQAREFMKVNRVDGYRRIIHPERSESGTCGLCVIASLRVYRREELMPIHERCECTVLPIVNGVDLGLKMNRADLKRIYEEAGGNTAALLKRTRPIVRQHGELGPVLRDAADEFRDEDAIPA